MNLVDTHCHIHFKNSGFEPDQAYLESMQAGVRRMICVGTTLADSSAAIEFAQNHEGVWAAVGVHPHEAQEFVNNATSGNKLQEYLKQPKVVAIGEIGLDYYKNHSPKEDQKKALRTQIELALPTGLPFIFHVRDSWSDFWDIFDSYKKIRGVIHSFSSGTKQMNAALYRGLFVGLNGIMTFTKDEAQLSAARQLPLDSLLLETDAPFLTPAPVRSEVCIPKHTIITAEFLAKLRGEPLEALVNATSGNAVKLFNLQ
jgi:TatD DNase family protein